MENLRAFGQAYPEGNNYLVVPHASEPRERLLGVGELRVTWVTPKDLLRTAVADPMPPAPTQVPRGRTEDP